MGKWKDIDKQFNKFQFLWPTTSSIFSFCNPCEMQGIFQLRFIRLEVLLIYLSIHCLHRLSSGLHVLHYKRTTVTVRVGRGRLHGKYTMEFIKSYYSAVSQTIKLFNCFPFLYKARKLIRIPTKVQQKMCLIFLN